MKNEKKLVPELRFENFQGSWKIETLGDLLEVYDGTHQTPKYKSSGIPFYSVETITNDNFKNTKYISRDVYEKEKKRTFIEFGDVLLTRIGDIGSSKFINWVPEASFYVSLVLLKTSNCDTISGQFLKQAIESESFQRNLWISTKHVAFPKIINLGDIKKLKVILPTIEEQNRIASFLTAIDRQCEIGEIKIKCVKDWKKGLLQRMFV